MSIAAATTASDRIVAGPTPLASPTLGADSLTTRGGPT
jgi:hypothetical protein